MATHPTASRQPHAVSDLPSRFRKAVKIERLLRLEEREAPLRLLEVGAGAGGICGYFADAPGGRYEVSAVDVVDNRVEKGRYDFSVVDDTVLPFPDASFDVVLSNHVIEHVGDDAAQQRHLDEIRRVLRPGGVGYLAMPNRWMLIEPHYRFALLSWWPERWRDTWLRIWGRGVHYDCRPLSRGDLQRRLMAAGFRFEQFHAAALRILFELERPDSVVWRYVLRHVPDRLSGAVGSIFPTPIYRLEPTRPSIMGGPAAPTAKPMESGISGDEVT